MNSALYEEDYYLWLEKTAQLLRKGKLSELDIPNLAAEIEDMGRSERRVLPACYNKARRDAGIETGLPCDVFPLESPFTVEEALSPNWLPD